jgi:uncharacterized membrane protein YoaK (UPF0700 family)
VIAASGGSSPAGGVRDALIVVTAVAMGIQSASARKLAVPDLTTNVLTMTITGIASDNSLSGGSGSVAGRRLISVFAMLTGALVGALFVVHGHIVYPLAIAFGLTVIVAIVAWRLGSGNPAWTHVELGRG